MGWRINPAAFNTKIRKGNTHEHVRYGRYMTHMVMVIIVMVVMTYGAQLATSTCLLAHGDSGCYNSGKCEAPNGIPINGTLGKCVCYQWSFRFEDDGSPSLLSDDPTCQYDTSELNRGLFLFHCWFSACINMVLLIACIFGLHRTHQQFGKCTTNLQTIAMGFIASEALLRILQYISWAYGLLDTDLKLVLVSTIPDPLGASAFILITALLRDLNYRPFQANRGGVAMARIVIAVFVCFAAGIAPSTVNRGFQPIYIVWNLLYLFITSTSILYFGWRLGRTLLVHTSTHVLVATRGSLLVTTSSHGPLAPTSHGTIGSPPSIGMTPNNGVSHGNGNGNGNGTRTLRAASIPPSSSMMNGKGNGDDQSNRVGASQSLATRITLSTDGGVNESAATSSAGMKYRQGNISTGATTTATIGTSIGGMHDGDTDTDTDGYAAPLSPNSPPIPISIPIPVPIPAIPTAITPTPMVQTITATDAAPPTAAMILGGSHDHSIGNSNGHGNGNGRTAGGVSPCGTPVTDATSRRWSIDSSPNGIGHHGHGMMMDHNISTTVPLPPHVPTSTTVATSLSTTPMILSSNGSMSALGSSTTSSVIGRRHTYNNKDMVNTHGLVAAGAVSGHRGVASFDMTSPNQRQLTAATATATATTTTGVVASSTPWPVTSPTLTLRITPNTGAMSPTAIGTTPYTNGRNNGTHGSFPSNASTPSPAGSNHTNGSNNDTTALSLMRSPSRSKHWLTSHTSSALPLSSLGDGNASSIPLPIPIPSTGRVTMQPPTTVSSSSAATTATPLANSGWIMNGQQRRRLALVTRIRRLALSSAICGCVVVLLFIFSAFAQSTLWAKGLLWLLTAVRFTMTIWLCSTLVVFWPNHHDNTHAYGHGHGHHTMHHTTIAGAPTVAASVATGPAAMATGTGTGAGAHRGIISSLRRSNSMISSRNHTHQPMIGATMTPMTMIMAMAISDTVAVSTGTGGVAGTSGISIGMPPSPAYSHLPSSSLPHVPENNSI